MSIKELPLAELLAGATVRLDTERQVLRQWATSQGYRPGTHRILLRELRRRFYVWCQRTGNNPGRLWHNKTADKMMAELWKVGTEHGRKIAYVSREIGRVGRPSPAEGGGGNGEGSTPGGEGG